MPADNYSISYLYLKNLDNLRLSASKKQFLIHLNVAVMIKSSISSYNIKNCLTQFILGFEGFHIGFMASLG